MLQLMSHRLSSLRSCSVYMASFVWLVAVWLLTTSLAGAEQTSLSHRPCADWDSRFQQRLTESTAPDTLVRLLAAHTGLGFTARFAEEKQISLLRRPLTSSGQLIFIPERGLYRHLQQPFSQELLMTSTAIQQRNADGQTETISLEALPVAQAFVNALLSLFSGSWLTLQRHFHVYFSQPEQHKQDWQLGLKPSNAAMAGLVSCLIVAGHHTRLSDLWVQEANGDITYDHFLDAQLLAQPQWADYDSQFDWAE